jgi:hypothetical protein
VPPAAVVAGTRNNGVQRRRSISRASLPVAVAGRANFTCMLWPLTKEKGSDRLAKLLILRWGSGIVRAHW